MDEKDAIENLMKKVYQDGIEIGKLFGRIERLEEDIKSIKEMKK